MYFLVSAYFSVGDEPQNDFYKHGSRPADREAHVDGLQGSQFREYRVEPGNSDSTDANYHQEGWQ